MSGVIYGIGVGPGDPDLMTIGAVKRLKACQVIAIPGKSRETCVAYKIAVEAVPEIAAKEWIPLPMPMTKDVEVLKKAHKDAVELTESYLSRGIDVGYLTLGDVSIYSTFGYLISQFKQNGYQVKLESGIPSFCAVSARLGKTLVLGEEQLHIIPASYGVEESLALPGVKVFMKAGKHLKTVKEHIIKNGSTAIMIENCGMEQEKIYNSADEIPNEAGYYSLVIVRGE